MSVRMTTDRQEVLETPPEEFAKSVKGALESLYDLPTLQRHPLAQGSAEAARPGESAGQRLRSELMGAIEALNPGPATPFRSPHARTFHLLHLHYVEGMTVQETARSWGFPSARLIATCAKPMPPLRRCSGPSAPSGPRCPLRVSRARMPFHRWKPRWIA